MSSPPYIYSPYRSAHALSRMTIILLIAGAVGSGVIALSEVAQIFTPEFAGPEISDNPAGFAVMMLHALFTLLGALIFIATAVVFLMWLHRSSKNLPAFGQWNTPGHSAAWAVGSYFLPIANLFMPYQAIKEIWQKSRPSESQSFSFSNSPPGFFPAWWGFWLASNFATNIYFRMSGAAIGREPVALVGILSEVLSIIAAALAIQVVKDIDRRQQESINHVAPGLQAPGPPPPPVFTEGTVPRA